MTKIKTKTPWLGLPVNLELEEYEGFVYLVTDILTQKKYVGRKYLWSKRKKRVKGKKRRTLEIKESDWQIYKSSSDSLKKDIREFGLKRFKFEVLSLHKTRAETNYAEVKEMFLRDVLYSKLDNGEFEYYNNCILNRYYRKKSNEDGLS